MAQNRSKSVERIPINPFWVGGGFLDYCARQGWVLKEREGKSLRYYVTPAGVVALRGFGIEIRVPAKPTRSNRAARRTGASPSKRRSSRKASAAASRR